MLQSIEAKGIEKRCRYFYWRIFIWKANGYNSWVFIQFYFPWMKLYFSVWLHSIYIFSIEIFFLQSIDFWRFLTVWVSDFIRFKGRWRKPPLFSTKIQCHNIIMINQLLNETHHSKFIFLTKAHMCLNENTFHLHLSTVP